jgi:hypothetical protein
MASQCGATARAVTTAPAICKSGTRVRASHGDPIRRTGRQERRNAATYTRPVEAAFSQMRLDEATIACVRASRTAPSGDA